MSNNIVTEIQSLSPGATIELFEVEVTPMDGSPEIFRFHAGTNNVGNGIAFGYEDEDETIDKVYQPYPIEAEGFDKVAEGSLPRPILRISNLLNIVGLMSAIPGLFPDLVGSRVRRIRTFKKFLNDSNFDSYNGAGDGINPEKDKEAKFPIEYFLIERKSHESRDLVEFELAVPWDMQSVKLPRRQILSNICPFLYRGEDCGYGGPPVANNRDSHILGTDPQTRIDDHGGTWSVIDTSSTAQDKCGKRLISCKMRFNRVSEDVNRVQLDFSHSYYNRDDVLPFGGFPGADRLLS